MNPSAARATAARAVSLVHAGRSLDAALAETLQRDGPALEGERGLIQEMTYGALRWHFQLQPLVREALQKPFKPKDADLEALLIIGYYQLLHMRTAAHAAVNETVEATRILKKDWAKGLVNAVLRRLLRDMQTVQSRLERDESLSLAHPDWLLARLQAAWPDDWRRIAAANNARPPLCLRVHAGRLTRAACLDTLRAAGIPANVVPAVDTALVLESPLPVMDLPGFRRGDVSVQDGAAQLCLDLLDVRAGMRVLDACAAPGGKAAHILERVPTADLTALDVDARRLERVQENFTRLGLHGTIRQGDATDPSGWWDGRPFDRILLDAPCSATGVIRRHPDIRLHRTTADIGRLAATQARLLAALWPLLATGGKLLYVTCSILPEENVQPLAAFLARHTNARALTLSHPALDLYAQVLGSGRQILPGNGNLDGFFFAALTKTAGSS